MSPPSGEGPPGEGQPGEDLTPVVPPKGQADLAPTSNSGAGSSPTPEAASNVATSPEADPTPRASSDPEPDNGEHIVLGVESAAAREPGPNVEADPEPDTTPRVPPDSEPGVAVAPTSPSDSDPTPGPVPGSDSDPTPGPVPGSEPGSEPDAVVAPAPPPDADTTPHPPSDSEPEVALGPSPEPPLGITTGVKTGAKAGAEHDTMPGANDETPGTRPGIDAGTVVARTVTSNALPQVAPRRLPSIAVANISDGGFVFWLLRFYAFGLIAVLGVGFCVAFGTYIYFAATLPPLPELTRYQSEVATTTLVRGWDGTPLAELATERRQILPFDRIPKRLVQAFLAAEDRRFYEHGGIDYRGIARALGANLRAGEVSQGGSTITQQVAKSFLTSERTIQRKIREAILATRLEGRLTKNDILTLYLNQIFLGAGAYGVGGGARRYFDKSVDELDVGEMATLAGLVRAPSRFSPLTNLEAARARRDQVLSAMVAAGYLSEAEATTWKSRPLTIRPRVDFFRLYAPYFTEHVRRDIARRYGDKKLWEGGLEIDTTVVPWIDASAQENVDFGLRKLDKRQGWRGPVARLSGAAADEFRRRALERYGAEQPAEGRLYLGIVESVTGGEARVRVAKGTYALPSAGMLWAVPYNAKDSTNGRTLTSTAGVLHPGDVIWVRNAHRSKLRRFSDFAYDQKSEVQWLPAYDEIRAGHPFTGPVELALEQTPRVQGAMFTYDHSSGYVLAMIGGDDYDRSEFNRVTQACRQPGSSYKPIYYSLALDRGYGFGSLLNDVPRAEVDPITGEVWTPTNLNNTVEYQVSLEYALIWSKNVPSVQLFKLMGGHDVEAWARRLGITTPIIPDQALALGASCSRMDEMTRAFSAFARNGVLVDPVSIRRVRDRTGRILEDNTWIGDPMGRPQDRLDQLVMVTGRTATPVISPRTAWLTSTLLRHVVTHGHAPAIRNASIMAAGKTGTSSATMDVWWIGYTSRWMTSSWVGDDVRERPLGAKDAAFMITVPMFARYINEVSFGSPLREIPWERPPGVKPNDTGGKVRTTVEEVVGESSPAPPKGTTPKAASPATKTATKPAAPARPSRPAKPKPAPPKTKPKPKAKALPQKTRPPRASHR